MRRLRLVLVLALVVLAHQQYPPGYHGPRSHVHYDPIHWGSVAERLWNDIVSPVTSAIDVVKEWCLRVINGAVSGVENSVKDVWAGLSSIGTFVDNTFALVRHDLASAVDAVWAGIRTASDEAAHLVETGVTDAEKYADEAVMTLWHDVVDPAVHELESALDTARHDIAHELDVVRHDVIDPIGHVADEAAHYAHEAAHWIDLVGADAIVLVEKCWKFLEWVADHPMHALEMLPKLVADHYVTPLVGELQAEETTVWDALAKELDSIANDFPAAGPPGP